MSNENIAREAGAVEPVAWRHLVHIGGSSHVWTKWAESEACSLSFGTSVRTECAYSQATVDTLRAQLEAAQDEVVGLRAGNIAYSQQVNELIGRTGNAEARAEAAEADAERYRWLCAGNGYFMEEEGLCGHGPDKDMADAAIDAARTKESAP